MKPIPETTEAIEEFGPFDPDNDLLQELGERAQEVLGIVPDCVGISVTSFVHGVTFTLVASDAEIAALDALQYFGDGPCIEAATDGKAHRYRSDEPLAEESWQLFARGTAAAGVSSTLSLPVVTGERVSGSVNLYAASADAFTDKHEPLARIFDAWAAGAVTNADLTFSTRAEAKQAPTLLREDLRIQIAIGVLASAQGLDTDTARLRLREVSIRSGIPEAELAEIVIESGTTPPQPGSTP